MGFSETNIAGVYVVVPKVFFDNRGYFFESYNKEFFSQIGIDAEFVQDNQSMSSYGVIRGLHYQAGEHAQAKLVSVSYGRVLDVAVDIRPGSRTYGQHVAVELSDENRKQLFIPRGLAHGFSVLSEFAIFSYKCDNLYNQESERGISFDDPDLAIDWQIPLEKMILSDKDRQHRGFKNVINNR